MEPLELNFTQYLQEKTGYITIILVSFYQKGDIMVEKGKITTDSQFYDITILVNHLSQTVPVDQKRIEVLDKLLHDYNERKMRPEKPKTQ